MCSGCQRAHYVSVDFLAGRTKFKRTRLDRLMNKMVIGVRFLCGFSVYLVWITGACVLHNSVNASNLGDQLPEVYW